MYKKGSKKCLICKKQKPQMYFRSDKPICRACFKRYHKPISAFYTREKFVRISKKILRTEDMQKAFLKLLEDEEYTKALKNAPHLYPKERDLICNILLMYIKVNETEE